MLIIILQAIQKFIGKDLHNIMEWRSPIPPGATRHQTEADRSPPQAKPNVRSHFGVAKTFSGINIPTTVSPFCKATENLRSLGPETSDPRSEAQKIGNLTTPKARPSNFQIGEVENDSDNETSSGTETCYPVARDKGGENRMVKRQTKCPMTKNASQVQANQNINMNKSVLLMTRGSVPVYLQELAELRKSAEKSASLSDSRTKVQRPRKWRGPRENLPHVKPDKTTCILTRCSPQTSSPCSETWPEYAVWRDEWHTKPLKEEPKSPRFTPGRDHFPNDSEQTTNSDLNSRIRLKRPFKSGFLDTQCQHSRVSPHYEGQQHKRIKIDPEMSRLKIPASVSELQSMLAIQGLQGVLNLVHKQDQLIRAYEKQSEYAETTFLTSPRGQETERHECSAEKPSHQFSTGVNSQFKTPESLRIPYKEGKRQQVLHVVPTTSRLQNFESQEGVLNRPVHYPKEACLQTPSVKLDKRGTKLRYFIGSTNGAISLGLLMPDNLGNRSQDIIDLEEKGGIPTIVQCGHILADSRKRAARARKKGDCENPHPLDVGETIVVTELAWLKRQPPYPKGVTDPAIFGDQNATLAAQAVALKYTVADKANDVKFTGDNRSTLATGFSVRTEPCVVIESQVHPVKRGREELAN